MNFIKVIFFFAIAIPFSSFGQKKSVFSKLNGSIELNGQYYLDDKQLGDFSEVEKDPFGETHFRTNNYLNLTYLVSKKISVNAQLESYEPLPLINYASQYKGTNLAQYGVTYNSDNGNLELTAGYFFEQFGSGLLLRSFEERSLGVNNALRGAKIHYRPVKSVQLKGVYGQHRNQLETMSVSDGKLLAFDGMFDLTEQFNVNLVDQLVLGGSFVQKYEPQTKQFLQSPETIHSFAGRLLLDKGGFSTMIEYNHKGNDIAYKTENGRSTLVDEHSFSGNALLWSTNYSRKGFGISATARRTENMNFFSERALNNPGSNLYNQLSVNYMPSLTKQYDYATTNIYIYNPQTALSIDDRLGQSGDIGGQLDVFYIVKKGSKFGGKYGTKIHANVSKWGLIASDFDYERETYSSSFLNSKQSLFQDVNLEVKKKFSKNTKGTFTASNITINKHLIDGAPVRLSNEQVNATSLIVDVTHRLNKKQSIRGELQHLWAKKDRQNWASSLVELNANHSVSVFASDLWNYGNQVKENRNHFYNFGAQYTKGSSRVSVQYGRQRGGLLCVGGICRFVAPNTGFGAQFSRTF